MRIQYDVVIACRGEEMKNVSLIEETFINTAMRRGMNQWLDEMLSVVEDESKRCR